MIAPERFTIKAQKALQRAQKMVGEYNQQQMEPEHLLASLLEDREGLVASVMKKLGIPLDEIDRQMSSAFV